MFDRGKLFETIPDKYDKNKYIKRYENVIIAKGGDGTLLKAINRFAEENLPFYGINAGTVGFLMNEKDILHYDNIETITFKRIKVKVTYEKSVRNLSSLDDKIIEVVKTYEAFNDLCIGGNMNSWISFDVTEKDEIFSKFKGGGLIISTTQGSTGINKNNGGVILPLSSNMWSITGDKTDRHIEYVIEPRNMFIDVKSRTPVTLWVDGSNEIIHNVKTLEISNGSEIELMFANYNEFKMKRRI